jgi:hypothetical protein
MAKDPAVLFYTNDFLTGTFTMSDEQVGKYIKLLCLQHQKGLLSEKDMLSICKSYDEDIFAKFFKTDAGFYNQRMKDEADKRKQYSESRRKNKMKKKDDEHMINISESYVTHMENENEDEIININKDKNISKNAKSKKEETELVFISDEWKGLWVEWIEYKDIQFKQKYKANKFEQIAINKLVKLSKGNLEEAQQIVCQSMEATWQSFYPLKNNTNVTTFTGNKPSNADIYKQRREEMHRIAAEIDRQRGIRP